MSVTVVLSPLHNQRHIMYFITFVTTQNTPLKIYNRKYTNWWHNTDRATPGIRKWDGTGKNWRGTLPSRPSTPFPSFPIPSFPIPSCPSPISLDLLPSPALPPSPFPFFSLPSFPYPFPPSLFSPPIPSPSLRSSPHIAARWSGERSGERLSSPSGSGRSPAARRFLVNFKLKIAHLVTIVLRSFSGYATTWSGIKGNKL